MLNQEFELWCVLEKVGGLGEEPRLVGERCEVGCLGCRCNSLVATRGTCDWCTDLGPVFVGTVLVLI